MVLKRAGAGGLLALDCDGVLLDYHLAYARAWQSAFGTPLVDHHPRAYWARNRFEVPTLTGAALQRLNAAFDTEIWSTMTALPGALAACEQLVRRGWRLVVVTAMPPRFAREREHNLRTLGFPVEQVIATGHESTDGRSPKAHTVNTLQPAAFVDDFAPFFRGVNPGVHRALIEHGAKDSPNLEPGAPRAHSLHPTLLALASTWPAPEHWDIDRQASPLH